MTFKDQPLLTFLSNFDPALQNELRHYGKIKKIEADTIVLDIREPINFLPIIIDGVVRVTRRDGKGNGLLLHYLTSFETCGLSFLNATQKKPNSVRLISKTKLTYIAVPINLAQNWFLKFENWRQFILKSMQEHTDNLIQIINAKTFNKLEDILINYLKYHQTKFKSDTINANHQYIARDLFVSRESVSRALKLLEKKGFLKLGRNKIILL